MNTVSHNNPQAHHFVMSETIWEPPTTDSNPLKFEDDHDMLKVSLFILNPVQTELEINQEIERVYKNLNDRFEPWINHYAWDRCPITFIMQNRRGYTYIYGELPLGDNIDDEWLVTKLLWDLSRFHEDLFIHISDSDGEILLVEGHEQLPEWMDPSNSFNRDWINNGRLVIIPDQYYADRGLKLTEALNFLTKASYRCLYIEELNDQILKRLKEYPVKSLKMQSFINLTIPRNYAGVVMKNHNVVSSAVLQYGKETAINTAGGSKNMEDDLVELKVRVNGLSYLFLDFHQRPQNSENNYSKPIIHQLVSRALGLHIKENKLKFSVTPSDEEIEEFNNRGDLLQKELLKLMIIEEPIEPDLSAFLQNFDQEDKDNCPIENADEAETLSKLERFFKDEEAGLEGINNSNNKENTKNTEDNLQSDTEGEDEDHKAREFLKSANLDIDEDDFFEYFAKEALKLSDEDLEKLRDFQISTEKEKKDGRMEVDEENDSASDEDDDYGEMDGEELKQSFAELIKSFKTEGAGTGPASTFLRGMESFLDK